MELLMLLYYALTAYHQLCCILHKIFYEPSQKADLYLSCNRPFNLDLPDRLMKSGIFRNVYTFDDRQAFAYGADITEKSSEIFESLEELANYCLEQLSIYQKDYENFYICADHYPLGITLAHRKIPYHFFEDAAGMFSRAEKLLPGFLRENPFQYKAVTQLNTLGKNDSVIKRYINIDAQTDSMWYEGFHNDSFIDFNVPSLLSQLTQEHRDMVFNIFEVSKTFYLPLNKPSALLLTGHYINLKMLTFKTQHLMYALLLDYFCDEMELYIKPHPNDIQGLYKEWFPDCKIINRTLPAELLPFVIEGTFSIGIIGFSRAVLMGKMLRNVKFGFNLTSIYTMVHRYFISTEFILRQNEYAVYTLGVDEEMLINFLIKYGQSDKLISKMTSPIFPYNREKNILLIIDDISRLEIQTSQKEILELLDNLEKDDIVIFINSKEDYLFYTPMNTGYIDYLLPIAIHKIQMREDSLQESGKEIIFMYSKKDSKRKEFLKICIDKSLQRTGVQINVDPSRYTREIFLEGMLHAAEKRILHLLEKS